MAAKSLAAIIATSIVLTGCARWTPQRGLRPVTFQRACPLRRAPAVGAFGETGVRAVYHFVVGGAQGHALRDFLSDAQAGGFAIMPMTIQMDGVDTMFVHGRAALHDQNAVDREFRTACALGGDGIYLTHVRHNPVLATGDIRVR